MRSNSVRPCRHNQLNHLRETVVNKSWNKSEFNHRIFDALNLISVKQEHNACFFIGRKYETNRT